MSDWRDKGDVTTGDTQDRALPRLDGRQETLRQRLSEISPELAEFYLGALETRPESALSDSRFG